MKEEGWGRRGRKMAPKHTVAASNSQSTEGAAKIKLWRWEGGGGGVGGRGRREGGEGGEGGEGEGGPLGRHQSHGGGWERRPLLLLP